MGGPWKECIQNSPWMRNSNLCPVRFTRSPLQMLNAYFVRAQCQAAGGRKGTKIVFLLSFRFLLGPCLSTIWKNGKGVVSLGPSRGLKGAAVGDPSGETLVSWGWHTQALSLPQSPLQSAEFRERLFHESKRVAVVVSSTKGNSLNWKRPELTHSRTKI